MNLSLLELGQQETAAIANSSALAHSRNLQRFADPLRTCQRWSERMRSFKPLLHK